MIDTKGYRQNVGIILSNATGQLFWARRIGQNAWQFPQGGIKQNETPRQALYRELWEEVGLESQHVTILGNTSGWLRYDLPVGLVRRDDKPVCIGQKQVWYMLQLSSGSEVSVKLDKAKKPEFDQWRWVDYWLPIREVVEFKREVYKRALNELAPLLASG